MTPRVLRWTAMNTSHELAAHVDEASTTGEVAAAEVSEPTPGARDLSDACAEVGPVLIVSNNAEPAIEVFLQRHQLGHLVQAVIGRVRGQPELMKHHPSSIQRALDQLDHPANRCVLIGDSVSDIQVSRATGVRSIGFAKNPVRGRELEAAHADATINSITDLATQIRRSSRVH